MAVKSATWSDRMGGYPDQKPFAQAAGAKSGQEAVSLATFGMMKLDIAMGILEKAKEMDGRWADDKRRQGCLVLLDAIKKLLDAGKWGDAFKAVQSLKANMQKDDSTVHMDGESMQAKIATIAGWKTANGIGSGENLRTIAETRTIACKFVVSKIDRGQYLQEIQQAIKQADKQY